MLRGAAWRVRFGLGGHGWWLPRPTRRHKARGGCSPGQQWGQRRDSAQRARAWALAIALPVAACAGPVAAWSGGPSAAGAAGLWRVGVRGREGPCDARTGSWAQRGSFRRSICSRDRLALKSDAKRTTKNTEDDQPAHPAAGACNAGSNGTCHGGPCLCGGLYSRQRRFMSLNGVLAAVKGDIRSARLTFLIKRAHGGAVKAPAGADGPHGPCWVFECRLGGLCSISRGDHN